MVTLPNNSSSVVQNMGLVDRAARFLIGGALVGVALDYYEMKHPPIGPGLQLLMVGISVYPLMTAMIGWDPFYALFHVRSCSGSGRNQCGTLPYQVKAMIGRAPKYCEISDEHSLEACHDSPEERPRHAIWRVDMEPMIYPSDAQLNAYFKEQARKKDIRKRAA